MEVDGQPPRLAQDIGADQAGVVDAEKEVEGQFPDTGCPFRLEGQRNKSRLPHPAHPRVNHLFSLGERIQRELPGALVVKCFNTVGNPQRIDPGFSEAMPALLIAGNDSDAKRRTEALLRECGWSEAIDIGGIDGARWLEALVPLWVRVGLQQGSWGHAFKVVR